jgi:hypothetical protein
MYKNLASFLFENFEFWQLKISKVLFSRFSIARRERREHGESQKDRRKSRE